MLLDLACHGAGCLSLYLLIYQAVVDHCSCHCTLYRLLLEQFSQQYIDQLAATSRLPPLDPQVSYAV